MPESAQFVALRDSDTAFPASGRLFTFDLADLDDDRTVILMFRVSGPRNGRLQMAVNPEGGDFSIDFELDSSFTRPRSWHEIVAGSIFQVGDNHLIVQGVTGEGGAFPTVSDIVVLYHAKAS
jgi:hypothetical protein